MLKNYMTIALRNLVRHRAYSLMNIIGLAVGMASCILILTYVQDELRTNGYTPHLGVRLSWVDVVVF